MIIKLYIPYTTVASGNIFSAMPLVAMMSFLPIAVTVEATAMSGSRDNELARLPYSPLPAT